MVDMTDGSIEKQGPFQPSDEDHATGKAKAVERFGIPHYPETDADRRAREAREQGKAAPLGPGVTGTPNPPVAGAAALPASGTVAE